MLALLRWIAFLPVAFVVAALAGEAGYWAGWFISEFYGYVMSGALSAGAFVGVGLFVAPKRNNVVKWLLVVLSVLVGACATFVSANGDDKIRMAAGISMILISLALAFLPTDELVKLTKDSVG